MSRPCAAVGCGADGFGLFCRRHWMLVPKALRQALRQADSRYDLHRAFLELQFAMALLDGLAVLEDGGELSIPELWNWREGTRIILESSEASQRS